MIYLDNAATSFLKPDTVYKKYKKTWQKYGANAGRGGHKLALEASMKIYEAAELVAMLFNIENPENIAFCYNATMALNMAIKGVLKSGDHAVITTLEHNSVLRPIEKLKNPYTVVMANEKGEILLNEIENAILPNTKLIVVNHASNVCKSVCDIEEIGKIAKKHDCVFLVDGAQSSGVLDIDVEKSNIDMLAFAGHKGLFGPQGTGGLYVDKRIFLDTIVEGGSGSESLNLKQPLKMPERLMAGTADCPGIAALGEGVKFVLEEGTHTIFEHENFLMNRFYEKIKNIENVLVYTDDLKGCGVLSINIKNTDPVEISNLLDRNFNIATRGGFHCAPLCHKMLKTIDTGGTVRFSFGYFNTKKDADAAAFAIYKIAKMYN